MYSVGDYLTVCEHPMQQQPITQWFRHPFIILALINDIPEGEALK